MTQATIQKPVKSFKVLSKEPEGDPCIPHLARAVSQESRILVDGSEYCRVSKMPSGAACPDEKVDVSTTAAAVKNSGGGNVGMARSLKRVRKGVWRITVPYSFVQSCAVSGVISGVTAVQPDANTTEWGAIAALFSEYRVLGGKLEYFLPYLSPAPASVGLNADSMSVVCYDPTNASSLTSVRQGTELTYHTLLAPSPVSVSTTTGSGTCRYGFRPINGKPFTLRWETSKASALDIQSGAISYSPGMWKAIQAAGSNSPDGSIKSFGISDFSVSAAAITGIHYVDLELRMRE